MQLYISHLYTNYWIHASVGHHNNHTFMGIMGVTSALKAQEPNKLRMRVEKSLEMSGWERIRDLTPAEDCDLPVPSANWENSRQKADTPIDVTDRSLLIRYFCRLQWTGQTQHTIYIFHTLIESEPKFEFF